jgi:hypothetical protein
LCVLCFVLHGRELRFRKWINQGSQGFAPLMTKTICDQPNL